MAQHSATARGQTPVVEAVAVPSNRSAPASSSSGAEVDGGGGGVAAGSRGERAGGMGVAGRIVVTWTHRLREVRGAADDLLRVVDGYGFVEPLLRHRMWSVVGWP
ncbi:hypothetical protein [Streptomyces albofaciens]|uniref:hypothetical protein n=1 Tax=Streptomyces albofaciens TaxID=66866 RepID=UPI00142F17C0|nr:hypothetical protein [Streptomyces albofaciens]